MRDCWDWIDKGIFDKSCETETSAASRRVHGIFMGILFFQKVKENVAFFGNPLRYDRETKFYKYSLGLRDIDIKHLSCARWRMRIWTTSSNLLLTL